MSFKNELYLKINAEHVRLNIDAPKKINLKADLTELPEESNGLVYLSDSPYGGTKSTTVLPSDNPEKINIKIPLRKLTSPLNLSEGGNGSEENAYGMCKAPSQTLTLEFHEPPDDSFNEIYVDVPEGTRWPPLGADDTITGVALETLLNEKLYAEMAYLYAIDGEFPGKLTGFHTNAEPEMDRTATINITDMGHQSFLSFARDRKGYLIVPDTITTIYTVYTVPILFYSDGFNNNLSMTLYDRRETFFDAISATSEHPFFRYLARCRNNNILLDNVLTAIEDLDVTQPYYQKAAGLLFMTHGVALPEDWCCILYENADFSGKIVVVKSSDGNYYDQSGFLSGRYVASEYGITGFNAVVCNLAAHSYYKLLGCAFNCKECIDYGSINGGSVQMLNNTYSSAVEGQWIQNAYCVNVWFEPVVA